MTQLIGRSWPFKTKGRIAAIPATRRKEGSYAVDDQEQEIDVMNPSVSILLLPFQSWIQVRAVSREEYTAGVGV